MSQYMMKLLSKIDTFVGRYSNKPEMRLEENRLNKERKVNQ